MERRPPEVELSGFAGVLACLLVAGTCLAQTPALPDVSISAVAPVGQATGQEGTTPETPAAVPQASQTVPKTATPSANAVVAGQAVTPAVKPGEAVPALNNSVWQWEGLTVESVQFEGVTFETNDALPGELEVQAGQKLDAENVRASMRRLFASGRYRDIEVRGVREGDRVALIFEGVPQYYVGRVEIDGVKNERLSSLLEFATKLDPGTAYTDAAGTESVKQTLEQNGYYEPKISVVTTRDDAGQQVNVTYTITVGPQARVGNVSVEGTDVGLTLDEFRKKGKLKHRSKVTRETTSNALADLRKFYQKKDRLEATVTMQKSIYNAQRKEVDYNFHANQGPVVKVVTPGVKFSKSRLHLLVPVYEEGTVDIDLLNEGSHNIREYLQQQGYFDVTASVQLKGDVPLPATADGTPAAAGTPATAIPKTGMPTAGTQEVTVEYDVDKGKKHKVKSVTVTGNKYFDTDLLKEHMQVQKADPYQRNGRYSASLLTADAEAIKALYRANGFSDAKVTTSVKDLDDNEKGRLKVGQIAVTVKVEEGAQQKFGTVNLVGVGAGREKDVKSLLNAQTGQPFSLITLSGDRDAVLGYYLSHGFDQAKVEIKQQKETANAEKMDVSLNVSEGPQVFVDHVLLSGIKRTRPSVVQGQLKVKAGDPLDQSALLDTQRNLYNLALFNEVNAAVQNPTGDATEKNVLVQITEAKRWDVTYGFGFEAETGTPSRGTISPASAILLGLSPTAQFSQEGKTGVSPRVSLDVSRINLRGTDQSMTLHTTYGLLETVANLSYNTPHLFGNKNFSATVSGGYSNVQDISTFAASTLHFDFRVTEKFRRTETFIYDFEYRRVKVDPNSLQVSANLIPLLSQPVRVGGPGLTWFRDTRQPTPLDAAKGSYTSLQEFLASSKFGSETSFNRVDFANSTYYQFGKRKYVLARNTRMGFETAFGANPNEGNQECLGSLLSTNASCNAVPLPERLYAGGATSHRGFPINGAGPRDLQTGYPVGGNGVFVNTVELRLPAPVLPMVGDSVSFVLFHDMGNVFQNVNDIFPSAIKIHQPNQSTCTNVSVSVGTCDFDYFAHALGMGARYKTPVGPIRADFSYNLNPPIYPVIYDFAGNPPHVGQAGHFNFFFSIGQAF